MAMSVIKVTLSTGKVVFLRELKISHTEIAAQEVAAKANGDSNLMSLLMQKALVKNLLVQIDGKNISATEREDMDALFSVTEYGQLLKVIAKISGGDEMGKEPTLEFISDSGNSGGK